MWGQSCEETACEQDTDVIPFTDEFSPTKILNSKQVFRKCTFLPVIKQYQVRCHIFHMIITIHVPIHMKEDDDSVWDENRAAF